MRKVFALVMCTLMVAACGSKSAQTPTTSGYTYDPQTGYYCDAAGNCIDPNQQQQYYDQYGYGQYVEPLPPETEFWVGNQFYGVYQPFGYPESICNFSPSPQLPVEIWSRDYTYGNDQFVGYLVGGGQSPNVDTVAALRALGCPGY